MDGDTFAVFTTEEGGEYHIEHSSRDQYEKAVASGLWYRYSPFQSENELIPIKMIAFLRVEDNHDFILGGSRDKPETWHAQFRAA